MVLNIRRMLCGYQSGALTARQTLSHQKRISFEANKEEMFVLGWHRIVLFDTYIKRNAPLVFMT